MATAALAGSDREWIEDHDASEMVLGARYRLVMTIRAPYTIGNITKLEDSLRLGVGVNNAAAFLKIKDEITIEQFQASYPTNQVGGTPTWKFTMIFRKTGGGTPLAIIIGAIALVVTLSILAAVVGHTIEKEAAKVKDVATSTVFNPFFIVAAVIVVLAVYGRSLKSIGGK
jgi:hypothetical protein